MLIYLTAWEMSEWRRLDARARQRDRRVAQDLREGNAILAAKHRFEAARARAARDALGTPGLPPDRTGAA